MAIYGFLIITQSLPMNIFDIHKNITGAYEEYIRSEKIKEKVEKIPETFLSKHAA